MRSSAEYLRQPFNAMDWLSEKNIKPAQVNRSFIFENLNFCSIK